MPRRPDPARRLRLLVAGSLLVACAASTATLVLASAASGTRGIDGATQRRVSARASVSAQIEQARAVAPIARHGRCAKTVAIRGVGRGCRTGDGLFVLPRAGEAPLLTHGPDLVRTTSRAGRSGGFGTTDSITCVAPSRTRHVVLAYLLPADAATAGAGTHGDRTAEVSAQLRQAALDAAATIDRRAGELAPGSRRRLRMACDSTGQPIVERVVLPRTASTYLASSDGGFLGIERDLAALGVLPSYANYIDAKVPAVRRVLAYYDGDFPQGIAGQGTLFRRTAMLDQGALARDPIVSRTVRNINNNPPSASLAIQYGTSYGGVPDPPLHTNLLHELAHTMGAVQDEPSTASDAGHCNDGLDLMCYDDGGRASSYVATACPDASPPYTDAADELFDCNGDTYFHPAPPAGSPLNDTRTWHLGLPANETLSTLTSVPAALPAVPRVTASGRGTGVVLRWPAVAGAKAYDVAFRPTGGTWQSISVTSAVAVPPLRERTDYELSVGAVDSRATLGPRATTVRRTGIDTTRPGTVGRAGQLAVSRTSLRIRFEAAIDNERVLRYRVERQSGRRWVPFAAFAAPIAQDGVATSPRISGLRPGTAYVVRIRAIDARGNVGAPSRVTYLATRR